MKGNIMKGITISRSLMGLLALSISVSAAANTEKEHITVQSDGAAIYISELNEFISDAPANKSKVKIQATSRSAIFDDFHFSYPNWTNISGSCKKLVFLVTSDRGYRQYYYTVTDAWETAGYPPYSDSRTRVYKSPVVSLSCSASAPGIEY